MKTTRKMKNRILAIPAAAPRDHAETEKGRNDRDDQKYYRPAGRIWCAVTVSVSGYFALSYYTCRHRSCARCVLVVDGLVNASF
jgi:hypothetical protein